MLRMASSTRSRSLGRTVAVSLITCDTVPIETPARSAICRIVTGSVMACPAEHPRVVGPRREGARPIKLLRVQDTTESDTPGAVHARRHQQQFAVLVQFVSLGKVPDRALRSIVTATAENAAARVLVGEFLGPLPDISYHVHHAEWAGSLRMSIDRIRTSHRARLVSYRHSGFVPLVAPRIELAVRTLGCVLPFPLMRQALSRPVRVGARIFLRDPRHRLVFPSRRIASIFPIAEKIQVILGVVVGGIQELLE